MPLLRAVGLDPSLRNLGMVMGHIDVKQNLFIPDDLDIVQPNRLEGKQVRQNSKDIHDAHQLAEGAWLNLKGADVAFVEVPVGSQSSRAMASYGICVGVLGALRSSGIPFIEVTPTEVKKAATDNKSASKANMIEWAMEKYPRLPWPMQTKKGVTSVIAGKAEHMADAVAAVHAGMKTNEFQQLLRILRNQL